MNTDELNLLQKLVGDIKPEQARNADCFMGENMGVFIPVVGPCYYSTTPNHTHPSYMFVLSYDDNSHMIIDGNKIEQQINRLCVISPNVPHQEVVTYDFSRFIAITLDTQYFHKELEAYNIQPDHIYKGEYFDIPKDMNIYLKDFMNEFENKSPGYQKILEAITLRITHLLIRKIHNIQTNTQKLDMRFEIDKAIEYMNSYYMKEISIDLLAEHAALSPSHFSRIFKTETGMAPITYLNDIRLEKAKKMLRDSQKNMTEIALSCGFNSSAYFSTSFNAKFKTSPTDFKKNL